MNRLSASVVDYVKASQKNAIRNAQHEIIRAQRALRLADTETIRNTARLCRAASNHLRQAANYSDFAIYFKEK